MEETLPEDDFINLSIDIIRDVVKLQNIPSVFKEEAPNRLIEIDGPWGQAARDYSFVEYTDHRIWRHSLRSGERRKDAIDVEDVQRRERIRESVMMGPRVQDLMRFLPQMCDHLFLCINDSALMPVIKNFPNQFSSIDIGIVYNHEIVEFMKKERYFFLELMKLKNLRAFIFTLQSPFDVAFTLPDYVRNFVTKPTFEKLILRETTNGLEVIEAAIAAWRNRRFFEVLSQQICLEVPHFDLDKWSMEHGLHGTWDEWSERWTWEEKHPTDCERVMDVVIGRYSTYTYIHIDCQHKPFLFGRRPMFWLVGRTAKPNFW
ncbi:hypothetical protein QR680_011160 [Steinernema hermaphroditum]|uniref:Uncharacterized protein n=1 Tax=Steinernema hermaphroditum TaxID=289476 RepID=A0AA39MD04_9BILA|nr:hypothetical protein QR680_011160 [Steinernema hermaphroditum]